MLPTGTLEDHVEIREFYARYTYIIDYGPYEEWVSAMLVSLESPN